MKYKKIAANAVNEKNLTKWERPKNNSWGPYIVDDSKFIPMSEAVKKTAKMPPIGNDIATMIYDFPDGKIKTNEIPFSRTVEGRGLAEKSRHLTEESKKLQKTISEAKAEAIAEKQRKAEFEAAIKAARNEK